MKVSNKIDTKIYIAWLACAVFYLYQYILRIFPNLMGHEIRQDFGINAEQFGLLGALTLYAYAFIQIPLGVIIDRIGIKYTTIFSIILCMISGYGITVTENIYVAYLFRILIGLGSASAFMSALKIASDYFPAEKRGLLIGSTLTFGTLGVVILTMPLLTLLENYGWRTSISIIAVIGIFIILVAFFAIPNTKNSSQIITKFSFKSIYCDFIGVLKNKHTWFFTIIAIGFYAPFSVIADLWGTDFLLRRFNISKNEAAFFSSMLYMGMALGSFILSWLGEKYKCAYKILFISMLLLIISFYFLIYGPNLNHSSLIILLIFIGFLSGAEMLCFSEAMQYCTRSNSGITIGFLNSLNISFAGIAQYIVGRILDMNWLGNLNYDGSRIYTLAEYHVSFAFMIFFLIACQILICIRGLIRGKYSNS